MLVAAAFWAVYGLAAYWLTMSACSPLTRFFIKQEVAVHTVFWQLAYTLDNNGGLDDGDD